VYENEKQKVEIQTGFYSSQQVGTDGGLFRGVSSTLKTCRSDQLHLAEAVKSKSDIHNSLWKKVAERVNISGTGIHKLVHRI